MPVARTSSAVMRSTFFDQRGIARGAEADVVREDHGAEHVVMAVYGVDAVEQGNLQPRERGVLLQAVVKIGPGLEAVTLFRIGRTAAED